QREILREFFKRLNVFKDRKNWLAFWGWFSNLSLLSLLPVFFAKYCSIPLTLLGFFYSMVICGSFGTLWFHRYGTHRAFSYRYDWFRNIIRNSVIKIIPDEIYIISHYVHHQISEKAGDPYNVHAGFLYCFLADVNHQPI